MFEFRSLEGFQSYEQVRSLQHELVLKRASGDIPNTVLFLEHSPVVTRGRGLQWSQNRTQRQMPAPHLPPEIEFCESERGGDLTYHGPGQLVVYPIVKLDGSSVLGGDHDVNSYLRSIEKVVVRVCARLGVEADGREGATGVWVGEKKVASMGVAIKKWVTYHGIAINVNNDLSPFHLFSPCGFQAEVMTRLLDLCQDHQLEKKSEWRIYLEELFKEEFLNLEKSERPKERLGIDSAPSPD